MNTDRDKLLEEYFFNKGKIQPSVSSGIGQALALGVAGIGDAYSSAAGRNSNGLKSSLDNLRNIDNSIEDERRNRVERIGEYLKSQMAAQTAMDKIKAENEFKLSENQKNRDADKVIADERNAAMLKAASLRQKDPYETALARERAKMDIKRPKEEALLNGTLNKLNYLEDYVIRMLKHPGLSLGVGGSSIVGEIPGTSAKDFQSATDVLKNKIAFDTLQELRKLSPTGGALGQISDRENEMLKNSIESLDYGQSEPQFRQNLKNIIKSIETSQGNLRSVFNDTYGIDNITPTQNKNINDKYIVGKKYRMKDDVMATYIGNGEFE